MNTFTSGVRMLTSACHRLKGQGALYAAIGEGAHMREWHSLRGGIGLLSGGMVVVVAMLCVLSASLRGSASGHRISEAVALRDPIMPIFNGLDS